MKFNHQGNSYHISVLFQVVANQHFANMLQMTQYSRQIPEQFPNREVEFTPVSNEKALFNKDFAEKFIIVLVDFAIKSNNADRTLRQESNLRYSSGRCTDLKQAKIKFETETLPATIPNLVQHLLAMGLDDDHVVEVVQMFKDKTLGKAKSTVAA